MGRLSVTQGHAALRHATRHESTTNLSCPYLRSHLCVEASRLDPHSDEALNVPGTSVEGGLGGGDGPPHFGDASLRNKQDLVKPDLQPELSSELGGPALGQSGH